MVSGLEEGCVALGEEGRDGDAVAEPLAQGQDVGRDTILLEGEEGAGAAAAGLNLVEDEQEMPASSHHLPLPVWPTAL